MKFNKISAILGAAALALGTAACGGGSDKADGPQELTYWSWLGGADVMVEAFNKSQTQYKVKFEKIPAGGAGGYEKMANAVKSGQVPDVVNIEYFALPEFASLGNVQDLSGTFGDTVKALPEGVQGMVNLGGKTWGVPRDASPQIMYYRKDLFEKHKVEVPKIWDDFKAAAAKLKKADKKLRLFSIPNEDPTFMAAMTWQNGGKWFATEGTGWKVSFNDPASVKVADYWSGLVKDDLIKAQTSFGPEWSKDLVDGNLAVHLGASWSAGGLRDLAKGQDGKWALAPIPTWDGTPASGMVGGASYAMLKGVKHTAGAEAFIKWAATTPESFKAQLGSGLSSALPANPALVEAAKSAFDTKFYGGQDVYALTGAQVASIKTGWTWGPVQLFANSKMRDAMPASMTNLGSVLNLGQEAASGEIKGRGLTLAP